MGDKPETRLLTEDEHAAIVADRVTRETASLSEQVSTLTTEKAGLQTQLDAKEVELAAANAKAETAERELAEFKADVERKAETAARSSARVEAVKAALPHLKDEFFTAERAERWAGMEEAAFTDYVAELAAANAGTAAGATPPRETAMNGKPVDAKAASGNFAELVSIRQGKKG